MPPDGVDTTRRSRSAAAGSAPRRSSWSAPIVFVVLILLWQLGVAARAASAMFAAGAVAPCSTRSATSSTTGDAVEAPERLPLPARRRLDARHPRSGSRSASRSGFFRWRARRARAAGLGGVSDPEDRAAAAVRDLVRHRRGRPRSRRSLFGTLFPTVVATYGGIDNVAQPDPHGPVLRPHLAVDRRKIVIPGALPAILSGFRISASIAVVLLVAAEMIGAECGIGAYILTRAPFSRPTSSSPASRSSRSSASPSAG